MSMVTDNSDDSRRHPISSVPEFTHVANPSLEGIPEIPSIATARRVLLSAPMAGDLVGKNGDGSARLLVPTTDHADILVQVMKHVHASYASRNLNIAANRGYSFSSEESVNDSVNRHIEPIPKKAGKAPDAIARGILVCAPARCGRTRMADAIEAYLQRGFAQTNEFGGKYEIIALRTPVAPMQFLRIRTLRVSWPASGKLRALVQGFISAFDAALGQGEYSRRTRGPFLREQDMIPAMCALAAGSHLGLLIVERINTRPATTSHSWETWDALGRFTRDTGIPVLCLATPGALTGLVEQGAAIGSLCTTGVHKIHRMAKGSKVWKATANAIYKQCFSFVKGGAMPEWFPDVLWDRSLGYAGLGVMAAKVVGENMQIAQETVLEELKFINDAAAALEIYGPHLQAVKQALQGGTFSNQSLRRYGDWLPLEIVIKTVPALEYILGLDAPRAS